MKNNTLFPTIKAPWPVSKADKPPRGNVYFRLLRLERKRLFKGLSAARDVLENKYREIDNNKSKRRSKK